MSDQIIAPLGVAASAALVLVAIAISVRGRLGLEKDLALSAVRALGQLLVLGVVLAVIISPGRSLWWSWLWVAVMIAFAAWTAQRRVRALERLWLIAAIAFTVSAVITLGVLFGFGVFPVNATTVIPLAGMMIGNSMTATVLLTRRTMASFTDHRLEVEARLSLGQSAPEAARPYLRETLRTALTPQIETTAAVGIVFLPGAMVGLLLAGVEPLQAVQAQIVVMYLILGSVTVTLVIVADGIRRRLFTPAHQLRVLSRVKD